MLLYNFLIDGLQQTAISVQHISWCTICSLAEETENQQSSESCLLIAESSFENACSNLI